MGLYNILSQANLSVLIGQAIAEMLAENTTLESLNIESNFMTAEGMMAIIKALSENTTLAEIKIDNQVTRLNQLMSHEEKILGCAFSRF